jgi:UDP-N-acetylglucosamine 2-epimerase
MKLLIVIGTRPNFIKVSPFIKRLGNGIEYILVHTGQHYDYEMSDQFFKELEIPLPDINLDVGSFPLNLRISLIMERLEAVCKVENPDFIIVVGDVDSTLAGALTAVRLGIKLIHIESGLRSFDWTMPEEINRVITDRFSNYLFVTEPSGIDNLEKEKVEGKKYLVGNVMADCLFDMMPLIKETERKKPYILLTLHRQSNVDDKSRLYEILSSLQNIDTNIVFPIHPRTKARIEEFGFEKMLKKY